MLMQDVPGGADTSDDDDDDAPAAAAQPQKVHRAEKGAHKIPSRPKSEAADFFADLL